MTKLFDDLQWRGLIYQMTDPVLEQRLNDGGLTVYVGLDPTADSFHIGNLLQLLTMARLQRAGHRPIMLAGGATGMIGDPSFKSSERQLLDDAQLAKNLAGINVQLQKFVDFDAGSKSAVLVNNADWTKEMSIIDFLRDVGKHVTVNTLLNREAVRARLEDREQGISYTEFSYSLLQANDYVHLNRTFDCTLQFGGSDQWGNILAGVDMVRRRLGKTVHAFSTPLVTKADGTKFGKTESGAVWLDAARTSPYRMYQFWMQAEDSKVIDYLKFYTFLPRERIEELTVATAERPGAREANRVLAEEVVTTVHGADEAARAKRASEALFSEAVSELDETMLLDVFADTPSAEVSRSSLGSLTLIDALVQTGLSPSTSAARTALQQGGVAVNNRRREGLDAKVERSDLLHDSYVVLRRGKREFAVLRFQ